MCNLSQQNSPAQRSTVNSQHTVCKCRIKHQKHRVYISLHTDSTESECPVLYSPRRLMPRLQIFCSHPSQSGMTPDFIPEQAPHDLVGCCSWETVPPHHL